MGRRNAIRPPSWRRRQCKVAEQLWDGDAALKERPAGLGGDALDAVELLAEQVMGLFQVEVGLKA